MDGNLVKSILRNVGGLLGDVSAVSVSGIPLGWGGSICLGESQSHVYPNKIMCVKFGCGPTVVSTRGGGTDRQTKGHCSFI